MSIINSWTDLAQRYSELGEANQKAQKKLTEIITVMKEKKFECMNRKFLLAFYKRLLVDLYNIREDLK